MALSNKYLFTGTFDKKHRKIYKNNTNGNLYIRYKCKTTKTFKMRKCIPTETKRGGVGWNPFLGSTRRVHPSNKSDEICGAIENALNHYGSQTDQDVMQWLLSVQADCAESMRINFINNYVIKTLSQPIITKLQETVPGQTLLNLISS